LKKLVLCIAGAALFFCGCILTRNIPANTGEPNWESATLLHDEYGSALIIERGNGEKWVVAAKTFCSWTMQYVGREVWLAWGPVQCSVKNDLGDVCEFWVKERVQ